jgi:hypothetical protein
MATFDKSSGMKPNSAACGKEIAGFIIRHPELVEGSAPGKFALLE